MPFSQDLPDLEALVGSGIVLGDSDGTRGRRWSVEERREVAEDELDHHRGFEGRKRIKEVAKNGAIGTA